MTIRAKIMITNILYKVLNHKYDSQAQAYE
jgi:hypothetical protein